jgi:hypothetical protein
MKNLLKLSLNHEKLAQTESRAKKINDLSHKRSFMTHIF